MRKRFVRFRERFYGRKHLFWGLIRLYNWLQARQDRRLRVHPAVVLKKVAAILEDAA